MELILELELLCGASIGITYDRDEKHSVTVDLLLLRLIVSYGPEQALSQSQGS